MVYFFFYSNKINFQRLLNTFYLYNKYRLLLNSILSWNTFESVNTILVYYKVYLNVIYEASENVNYF